MRLQCSIQQTTSTESPQYSAALGSKTSTFLGGFEGSILIFVTSSLHSLYPHSAARNSAFPSGELGRFSAFWNRSSRGALRPFESSSRRLRRGKRNSLSCLHGED